MISNIKIILISIVFLLGTGFIFKSCYHNKTELKKDLSEVRKDKDTSIKWIDMFNNEHLKNIEIEGKLNLIKALHKNEIDSIIKLLKLKDKQLNSFYSINLELKGKINTKPDTIILPSDTVFVPKEFKGYRFSWNDDYFSEIGFLNPDTTIIYYKANIPVKVTSYWKWKHKFPILRKIWCGKNIYIDAYSTNKNISIIGLKGYKIN